MVRDCAELAVRQCLDLAPATDGTVRKRVDEVMEKILAETKQTFFAIHNIDDKAGRQKMIKDHDPQPISALMDLQNDEDCGVDTLSRTVLANLSSVTWTAVDNIERYEVPIQTMVEGENLVLAINRVKLSEGSGADARGGVQYSLDFALRDLPEDEESFDF